jgi:two-component system response regulator
VSFQPILPPPLSIPVVRPIHILLVEDSPSDAAMTVAALRDGRIANEMHVVGDGEEAIEFLHRIGNYRAAPRADLILLDLNLPKKDGREVLADIKTDKDLMDIPVVVLTTSSSDKDVLDSYKLHANSYVTKPVNLDDFLSAVRGIGDFWLSLVRLPR